MNLGDRVRLLREQQNLTQTELALKMGYKSKAAVCNIENGRPVSQKIIVKLAEALNTTPVYLIGWLEEKEEVPTVQLSDEDLKFIELLHLLDPDKKEKLLALLEVLAST